MTQENSNPPRYSTETDKSKLLNALGYDEDGVLHRDRIVMRLLDLNVVSLTDSIDKTTKAIEDAATASNSLGARVFWLNIVLGTATVAGFIVGVISLFK